MMPINISPLLANVKQFAVLTSIQSGNKFAHMRYGLRLKAARGDMTQARLSELSGVSQSLISQLENSETATGSEYTVRLARALNISADWLADEIGDMLPNEYTITDPKIIAVARVMQELPEYGKDAAAKDIAKVAELIQKATHGGNGTDG